MKLPSSLAPGFVLNNPFACGGGAYLYWRKYHHSNNRFDQ
jgi:hypothetical protein